MKTLVIDTHYNDILVFSLKDGKIVDKQEVINKKNNSEYMFSAIKKILDFNKIDEIIVVNGPGSFTGVRLGVTIAKTLAYTLNIPIKTITSLEVSAISNNVQNVAISDGNGFYLGNFDNKFNKIKDYVYVGNNDIIDLENYQTKYTIDAEKIWQFLQNKDAVECHMVNPIYIKKIGVELDKKSN